MTFVFVLSLFCSLAFFGCSPGSLHDFKLEGQSVCRQIVKDLETIQSREDLARIEPILKKSFERLVAVILQARQYQMNNPEEALSQDVVVENEISDILFAELQRVYALEGAKEIIERAQREAMLRLDGFEKIKGKQKSLRVK